MILNKKNVFKSSLWACFFSVTATLTSFGMTISFNLFDILVDEKVTISFQEPEFKLNANFFVFGCTDFKYTGENSGGHRIKPFWLFDITKKNTPVEFYDGTLSKLRGDVIFASIAFHPTKQIMAGISAEKNIIIYDVSGTYGEIKRVFIGETPDVSCYSMVMHPTKNLLAASFKDQTLIWNSHTGSLLEEINHKGEACRLFFHPTEKILFLASSIKINSYQFNYTEEEVKYETYTTKVNAERFGEIKDIMLDPNNTNQLLITCLHEDKIKIIRWDKKTDEYEILYEFAKTTICALSAEAKNLFTFDTSDKIICDLLEDEKKLFFGYTIKKWDL